ncbi:MAG: hypothetical protein NTW32_26335 [Chloroflexi bacterium]|nr:hypothetical protein [Chloroflexota bacterium]
MMTRIPIMLDEKDALALSRLARHEYRDIRQQAAVIIRDELTRRGMLPQEQPTEPYPQPLQLLQAAGM